MALGHSCISSKNSSVFPGTISDLERIERLSIIVRGSSVSKQVLYSGFCSKLTSTMLSNSLFPNLTMEYDFPTWRAPRTRRGYLRSSFFQMLRYSPTSLFMLTPFPSNSPRFLSSRYLWLTSRSFSDRQWSLSTEPNHQNKCYILTLKLFCLKYKAIFRKIRFFSKAISVKCCLAMAIHLQNSFLSHQKAIHNSGSIKALHLLFQGTIDTLLYIA